MWRLFYICFLFFTAVAYAERIPIGSAEADREVMRVEQYFNNLSDLRARFSQINPDGSVSEGVFYLSPPSRMRFEYSPPAPYLLISTGRSFLYIDRDLQEVTRLSLSDIPLGFLLRERVSLNGRDHRLDDIVVDADVMVMNLELFVGDVRSLDLRFGLHPFEFWGWRIYLSDGGEIDVVLRDMEGVSDLSADLFRAPRWNR